MKRIIFFITIILLFIRPVFDLDLGWHLMVGKFISQTKTIPQTDIFTFSMPNYPYVYHSWLTEFLLYQIYQFANFWGITMFYSTIGALGTWFLLKIIQLKNPQPWTYSYILISTIIIVSANNLRIQIITFTFLSLIYYFYTQYLVSNSKFIYTIPLIFLLWANLHGGFILGFVLLTILIFINFIQNIFPKLFNSLYGLNSPPLQYKKLFKLIGITILSIPITLINPYTYRIYQQAWRMGTNTFAREFNTDWASLFSTNSDFLIFAFFLSFLVFITLILKNRIPQQQKLLIILFFALSLYTKRYIVPLIVILIPSFSIIIDQYLPKLTKITKPLYPLNRFLLPFFTFTLFAYSSIWIINSRIAYSNLLSYDKFIVQNSIITLPYKSIQWIKNNPLSGNTLNDFNWGGYLAWRLPEQKTFIDGRMDNFFINGKSFAKQYSDIINLHPNWQTLLKKYQIQNIFISNKNPLVQALSVSPDWQLLYQDEIAVIYTKKLPLDF